MLHRIAYFFVGNFAGADRVAARLHRFDAAIQEWYSGRNSSVLVCFDADEYLVIFDTRVIARHPITILREPCRSIYLDCTSIRGHRAIIERAAGLCDGLQAGLLDAAIEILEGRRLLMREGSLYLSLALVLGPGYHLPDVLARQFYTLLPSVPRLLGEHPEAIVI